MVDILEFEAQKKKTPIISDAGKRIVRVFLNKALTMLKKIIYTADDKILID